MHVRTYATIVALGFPFVACQDASRSVDTRPVGPGGPGDTVAQRAAPEVVPGQYIVVFHDAVTDPGTVATALVSGLGGSMLHIYTSAIKGFAARLPASAVDAIQRNPLVASVEPDQVMRADVTQAMDANGDPWGLDRIDQGALPLSRTYSYTSTGAGVHAYSGDGRVHCGGVGEDRRQGVVFQLGYLRRSVRAGVVDQVHLHPRDDHDPERHVDGHTARHGRGCTVQGDLRRRNVGDGVELDHQQCHDGCHHGESVGDTQPVAVQDDAVMRN